GDRPLGGVRRGRGGVRRTRRRAAGRRGGGGRQGTLRDRAGPRGGVGPPGVRRDRLPRRVRPPPLDAPDCGRRRPVRWRALPAARRRRRTRWDGWLVHPRPRLTGGTACAAPHRAAASGRPVVRAVLDPRLAAGAEWAQRRVHDEEPVAPGGALVAVAPPPPERGVGPLGLLEAGPPLPRRDGPEQEALGLVAHRRLPRSGEGPAVLLVQRHCGVGHVLEEVACLALLERELLL